MSPKEDFYIGRKYDLASGETQDTKTLYDPDDLTTHGVGVGMTGSGKTGLSVDILEEAALAGIPALLVDPKGDIPIYCCTSPFSRRKTSNHGSTPMKPGGRTSRLKQWQRRPQICGEMG